MREIETKGRLEQQLLILSVAVTLGIGGVGVLFGILSGSFSILFDGIYALIDASVGLLALAVARLILRDALRRDPASTGRVRYQFGFWHLEPMVLGLNAVLPMGAAVFALASAITLLLDGGADLEFGWAIVYAVVVSSICFAMAAHQRWRNRRLGSGFVALDAKSWLMSGSLTLALLVAFGTGAMIEGTQLAGLQPYIDPAALALVCLVIIPLPLSDLRRAAEGVLLLAPADLDDRVTAAATAAVARHGMIKAYTYVARAGRSDQIEIHFLVPSGWPVAEIAAQDAIRDEVGEAIGGAGPNRWLTVAFTADPGRAF